MSSPASAMLQRFAQARQGDADAMESLLVELYPCYYASLVARLRCYPDAAQRAEDLAQEVSIRIVRFLPDCQATTERGVIAWALMIA